MFQLYFFRKLKAVAAAAIAFAICCGAVADPVENSLQGASAVELDEQISEYRQKLNELDKKQQELDTQMDNAESSIASELEKQKILDESIKNTYDKISTMEIYISELEDDIADLDSQIRNIEQSIEVRQEQIDTGISDFGKRLRAMYINGEGKYTEVILDSGDFYDTLMRFELVKRVAGYDDQVIDELVDMKKQQEAEAVALENKRSEITEMMSEYSQELQSLQAESEELEELYAESTKSIEDLRKWQSEYIEQQKQLEADKNAASDNLSELEKQKQEEERRKAFELEQQRLLEEQRKREEQERLEAEQEQNNNSDQDEPDDSQSDDDQNEQDGSVDTDGENYDDPDSGSDDGENGDIGEDEPSDDENYDDETVYSGDISAVINMARSMVGGSYSMGAASPTVSDCSGLTMQCYAKIGIYLPHKASMQASYGREVSYYDMQPGDLIFYGGSSYSSIYHVALYIGDGKIIHAENYNTGIVVSNSDTVAMYNHVTVVKRLVG